MRTLLVTGGAGFIGSNFVHHCLTVRPEWRIVNLDVLTYAGNIGNFEGLPGGHAERHRFIKGDIRDTAVLEKLFLEEKIDGVIHFAAESHVDRSVVEPGAFIQTNILGTFCLLEAARKNINGMTRFHHVSTDEVYGSLDKTGYFSETTPYRPNSPYSASKAGADHIVRAYHKTYGLPVTLSNCSNNFGPFQFPEKLIPLVILNCLENKPLPVYGKGLNVRDWLYVKDHCVAVWEVMKRGKQGETYNIGGGEEFANIRLVEMICDVLDQWPGLNFEKSRRDLITFVGDRPGHDFRYAIDCSKLKNELGWAPGESFETGINKTIKWYMENRQWVNSVQNNEYQSWIEKNYQDRS